MVVPPARTATRVTRTGHFRSPREADGRVVRTSPHFKRKTACFLRTARTSFAGYRLFEFSDNHAHQVRTVRLAPLCGTDD